MWSIASGQRTQISPKKRKKQGESNTDDGIPEMKTRKKAAGICKQKAMAICLSPQMAERVQLGKKKKKKKQNRKPCLHDQ